MSHRQTLSSRSLTKGFRLSLQPALAWTAILALIVFTALGILAGAGKILNLVFPAGAFALGVFLYFRYPILYIGFSWWMLFLTPLVRRLADYRSSYTEPSPMLLAPYLVTGVTLVTVWQHLPKAHRQGGLPFVLSSVGVTYGFLIGLIYTPPFALAKSFLDWLTPVTFGFHLFVNWRDYPSYRQNIQRTFLWAVLVMGIYGVAQFVELPEWDRLWLRQSGIVSAGNPSESGGLRVWSTMNSTEPFAAVMAGGVLLLLSCQGALRFPASAAGYLAFLLTMVRSAWIGWLAGLLILTGSLKPNLQMRLIIIVLVMAVCVVPLTTLEPFSEKLGTRIESFSNLKEDHSAKGRQEYFIGTIDSVLTNWVGNGLGRGVGDSAFLSMFLEMGWLGVIFYMGGILLLVFRLFQGSEGSFDIFIGTARAIVVSVLVRVPVNAALAGASGILFWGFLGIGLAAQKYYQHKRIILLNQ